MATTIAFPMWGAVSDRFGPLVGMRLGGAAGVLSLVGYALAPEVGVLFVAAALGGIAGASIDVGIGAVVSEQTSLATRSAAMAGWNALTGARGIVAAFLMSALVQAGIVDVSTGLLLCATSSVVGVALFVRTRPGVPVETRAWEFGPGRHPPGAHGRARLTYAAQRRGCSRGRDATMTDTTPEGTPDETPVVATPDTRHPW